MMRRFVAAGVGILLVLLLLIWFFASRGNGSTTTKPADDRVAALTDYANSDTVVRFTARGRVNARENHRVLQITVGRSSRVITVFEGYEGRVLKTETFLNDEDAYRTFLSALNNDGFTKKQATNVADDLGACATGRRFTFDILDGSDTKQSLWATTCGSAKGSFGGRRDAVRLLFENQVPDYNAFVRGLGL